MDNVIDFIIANKLIDKGDRVGVGVSGGEDSMALLHFLNSVSKGAGFEVVAVNVNHNIRETSRKESLFVSKYCKQNNIPFIGYNVDVPTFARSNRMGLEAAARVKRYESFEAAIKKAGLTKFALAHHQSDQAETILLHIFRGSGIAGARGMDVRRGIYIRPFLETMKADIVAYNYRMNIPHVQDASNFDNTFQRNFIRNQIIPALQSEWRNVEKNIIDFGNNCRRDDEYLNSVVDRSGFMTDENVVRVPLNLFCYAPAVTSRIIISALEKLGARENIERKHIEAVQLLARNGENGARADLPNSLFAIKEYEYMAIVRRQPQSVSKIYSFKIGKTNFAEFGTISVTKTISYKPALRHGTMVIDVDKLPRTAKWRTRKEGDIFTKFGGGTKPLAAFMIDKKVPSRLRDKLPVLAHGNEIYAIAGMEISDKVKVDDDTIEGYVIEFIKD